MTSCLCTGRTSTKARGPCLIVMEIMIPQHVLSTSSFIVLCCAKTGFVDSLIQHDPLQEKMNSDWDLSICVKVQISRARPGPIMTLSRRSVFTSCIMQHLWPYLTRPDFAMMVPVQIVLSRLFKSGLDSAQWTLVAVI